MKKNSGKNKSWASEQINNISSDKDNFSEKHQNGLLKESLSGENEYLTTNYDIAKGKFELDTENKSLSDKYEEQRRTVQILEKASQHLAAETDIDTILKGIATTTAEAIGAKYVNFWDFTPDRKGVFIIAHYGMKDEYMEHSRKDPIPNGAAWVGRAMSTGKAWATSDAQTDPLLPKTWLPAVMAQEYHGLLCVPLIKKDQVIGGMCIYFKDKHEFEYTELETATIVANQAATALENSHIISDLKTERNKTLSIINSLNDGLIMYDLENKVTVFNPRAEELLWVSEESVIGRSPIIAQREDNSPVMDNFADLFNFVQAEYVSKEYASSGPHKVFLSITFIPVYDENKRKIGSMHILRDITKEKEVDLLKANFITTASHQLRTPLTGIKWSLQSLVSGEAGILTEDQRTLLSKASISNEHLIHLIDDLLDASKIEEGRFGYSFEKEDISPVVAEVVESASGLAKHNNVSIELAPLSESLPEVFIDRMRMSLAVRNLIDNAIKYSVDGGVVRVGIKSGKSSLIIFVEDHGIGIPKDSQKFIFNKFFRAPNAVKYKTDGSGLGLFITKSIVDKHNGTVSFESDPGIDTVFSIQLPINQEKMPRNISIYNEDKHNI